MGEASLRTATKDAATGGALSLPGGEDTMCAKVGGLREAVAILLGECGDTCVRGCCGGSAALLLDQHLAIQWATPCDRAGHTENMRIAAGQVAQHLHLWNGFVAQRPLLAP